MAKFNLLANLQLLTSSENTPKNATPFEQWLKTRNAAFRKRHLIPVMTSYGFESESFEKFYEDRQRSLGAALRALA